MSDWRIVVPDLATNKVLNPSAEIAGNFAAAGGAAVVQSTTYQKYGLRSYSVITAANNDGMTLTLETLLNLPHYVTVLVRGTLPASWDWSLDNVNYYPPNLIMELDADWSLYGYAFPAVEAIGSTTLHIHQNGAGAGNFYLDAVQVEEDHTYWTTYVDGDQPGCEWLGPRHASASTRSAQSRAGGRLCDLQTDYHLEIGAAIGIGLAPQSLTLDTYAILPGGELNSIKVQPRSFSLTGVIRGTSLENLHLRAQELHSVLLSHYVPPDADGPQPVRIWYTGAEVVKQIAAHYEGGLEGAITTQNPCGWQRVSVRFLAPDPNWYEIGESAAILDHNDSATFRIVAGRLRDTGQWDNLGPPGAPGTAVYNQVRAIAEDETYLYLGGNFLNFNNNANDDYIVRYHKQTGAYSSLGVGLTDSQVYALAVGPDGTLYAGGSFLNIGGVACSRIAAWNGVAWAPLGVGMNAPVEGLAIGPDGTLYAGGQFTTAGGIAANYVAQWNGAVWAAMGAGMGGGIPFVHEMAVGLDGIVYAGGSFVTADGGAALAIAQWDGVAWSDVGGGMADALVPPAEVDSFAVASNGTLYAGGYFESAGGVPATYIAAWNGAAWSALGSGTNQTVFSLAIGPDDMLYAGGTFTLAGGLTLADRIAKWNGSSWAHLDADLPGALWVWAILASEADPIIQANYDLWLGFGTSGVGYFAGTVTVDPGSTAPAYPRFVVSRAGGTSAILEELRNETTGRELLFDYSLLDTERLTVDLTPTVKGVESSYWKDRLDAVFAASDFGLWALQPGANQVTCFVAEAGAPTVEAALVWRTPYQSAD